MDDSCLTVSVPSNSSHLLPPTQPQAGIEAVTYAKFQHIMGQCDSDQY